MLHCQIWINGVNSKKKKKGTNYSLTISNILATSAPPTPPSFTELCLTPTFKGLRLENCSTIMRKIEYIFPQTLFAYYIESFKRGELFDNYKTSIGNSPEAKFCE